MRNAGVSEDGDMNEDVLPPSSLATKPNPLASSNHFTFPMTETAVDGSGATRRGRSPSVDGLLWTLDNARRVDFDHPRHLRTLGARADLDAQFRSRRNHFVACGMQSVGMQEGVALATGQLDNP